MLEFTSSKALSMHVREFLEFECAFERHGITHMSTNKEHRRSSCEFASEFGDGLDGIENSIDGLRHVL